jgi:hypothetical protein
MNSKRLVLVGIVVFVVLGIVGEMDYRDEQRKAERAWLNCIDSMGAITDMQIQAAGTQCAFKTGYIPKENDWP